MGDKRAYSNYRRTILIGVAAKVFGVIHNQIAQGFRLELKQLSANSRTSFACYQPPLQARQQPTHFAWYPRTQTCCGQPNPHISPANEDEKKHWSRIGGLKRIHTLRRFTSSHAYNHTQHGEQGDIFRIHFSRINYLSSASVPF